jgi:hypothetical protein
MGNEAKQQQLLDMALLKQKQEQFGNVHGVGSQLKPEDVQQAQDIGLGPTLQSVDQKIAIQPQSVNVGTLPPILGGTMPQKQLTYDTVPTGQFTYGGTQAEIDADQARRIAQGVQTANTSKIDLANQLEQFKLAMLKSMMPSGVGGPQQTVGAAQISDPNAIAPGQGGAQSKTSTPVAGQPQTSTSGIASPRGFMGLDLNKPVDPSQMTPGQALFIKSIFGENPSQVFAKPDTTQPEKVMVGGKGPYLWDAKTRQFLTDSEGNKMQAYQPPNATLIAMGQGGGQQPGGVDLFQQTAQKVLRGEMAPSQAITAVGGMGTLGTINRGKLQAAINQLDPNFNMAAAESNFAWGKNAGTQNVIRFADNITRTIPVLSSIIDKIPMKDNEPFNYLNLKSKKLLGDSDVAAFDFVQSAIQDETAKILQGGSTGNATSDAKMVQAGQMLNHDMTKGQWKSVLEVAKEVVGLRRGIQAQGTYMQGKPFGGPGSDQPINQQGPTGAVDPNNPAGLRIR